MISIFEIDTDIEIDIELNWYWNWIEIDIVTRMILVTRWKHILGKFRRLLNINIYTYWLVKSLKVKEYAYMTYVHEIKTDTTETNRQFKDNSLKFQQITFNNYRQL